MSYTRKKLISLLLKQQSADGFHLSHIPGVDYVKFSVSSKPVRTYWSSAFVIILQGHKEISLEDFTYKYKEAHTILTPVGLPVLSRRIIVGKGKPFLAIRIALDPLELHEVALKVPSIGENNKLKTHGIITDLASEPILLSALRLVELSKEDAPVLGPMIIREIYYHLLKSENGSIIRQFVLKGSKLQVITNVVQKIRKELTMELDVEKFAKSARMSRTSFFSAFKEITAMSPIQFQKKLRLLEARHLLSSKNETAENAAYAVGYKSASQFSREFSRMFGHPPGMKK